MCTAFVLFAFVLFASCARPAEAGYSGPYPSAAAQRALVKLAGSALPLGALGDTADQLVIESFAVVPNPVTGKGPVVRLHRRGQAVTPVSLQAAQGADGVWYLPVVTDGDAADLVRRATGSPPADFGGPTSAVYRDTLALDGR